MPKSSYWYVGVSSVSVPYWNGVVMFEMNVEDQRVVAPMLFTMRAGSEEMLRVLREGMPDAYLRAVGEYGERDVNEALDTVSELRVFEIEPWVLSENLENSALTYAMVDDRLMLARWLSEELRGV